MNRLKIICALICIMMINTTSAVFFTGEALKKDDVTVVILGDMHSSSFTNTQKQREALQIIARSAVEKGYSPFFIFEDSITYSGTDINIKFNIARKRDEAILNILWGVSGICKQENIPYVSAECRYELTNRTAHIKENRKTIESLKKCNNNQIFQKYLNDAIAEHDFYIKSQAEDPAMVFLNSVRSSIKLLNLNVICEFSKAFQLNKHKLFVIGVGAAHAQHISEMLQNIFNFKTVLQKNPLRAEQALPNLGAPLQQQSIHNKIVKILNEQYALDLPQFFQEALKAQPIRSRL